MSQADNPRPSTSTVPGAPNSPRGRELSMDEVLLKSLEEEMTKNLGNELLSVEDLAEAVALSRSQLHRKLRGLLGKSISQFIKEFRLSHGLELLKQHVGTVSEISYRVGFSSVSYFIKCFHETYGFRPGEVKSKVAEGFFEKDANEGLTIPTQSKTNEPERRHTPLESLHPAASESLIREVFESLIKYKPSLSQYLEVDEDELEEVDVRLLAYQILKSYPWPIAVELRRLFTTLLKEATKERFEQLQKTILRIVKMKCFLLIGELIDCIESGKVELRPPNGRKISKALEHLSPDNSILLLDLCIKALGAEKETLFVAEIAEVFDEGYFLELKDWSNLSSEDDPDVDFAEATANLEQILIFILKKSAFLVRYKFVNVDSIVVNKTRFNKAHYEHKLHILNSSDAEFKIHEEVMTEFSDSNAVLLMQSIRKPKAFLNLSPFIIDTHGEQINTKEKSLLKRDVFIFDSFDGKHLRYVSAEAETIDDLKELHNYPVLMEEYEQINQILNQ